jgi:drug/metabolite transporter (DMT)-like permease
MVDSSLRNRHGLRMLSPLPQDGEGRPTAILLILAAAFVFALSDTAAKFVVGQLPPLEVHWFRSVVVLVLSGAVILRRSGLGAFRTAHPVLQTVRGLCVMGASLLFLSGLVYLPVADASAINFVWPLLITVFSVILLKEQVGLRRALATAAGFLGMLVIMRPGSGAFHPAAVFPLGAAVVWAFASVLTRMMSRDERTETTILWSAAVACVLGTIALPFVFVMPTSRDLAICGIIGLGSAAAHAMVIHAFSQATASSLAPYTYSQLIWAALCGWLFFGSLPDGWTIAGAAIIAASGIYTAHRERVRRVADPGTPAR